MSVRRTPSEPLSDEDVAVPIEEDPLSAAKEKENVRRRTVRSFLFYGGWGYDVLSAALSVVDVLSDLLVAQQFYMEGHMVWFWMVIASLIVSNVLYAAMLVGEDRLPCRFLQGQIATQKSVAPLICAFILVFPIAQVYPLLQWYQETFNTRPKVYQDYPDEPEMEGSAAAHPMPQRERAQRERADLRDRQDSWHVETDDVATIEELADDITARDFVHNLNKSMQTHMTRHKGFYIETVVESIPQGLIQLLAVTALGQASNVQLLSMCLSLFSIVTKAYVVSRAFELRVFLFKICLVAHDIFSLFFIFSTLVAKEEPKETTIHFGYWLWFFGVSSSASTQVSMLSACWFLKAYLFLIYTLLVGAGATVQQMFNGDIRKRDRILSLIGVGAFAVLLVPVLVTVEAIKLIIGVGILDQHLPSAALYPYYANVLAFYMHGFKKGDANRRVAHIVRRQVQAYVDHMKNQLGPRMEPRRSHGPPAKPNPRFTKAIDVQRQWEIDHYNKVIDLPDFDITMLKVPDRPSAHEPTLSAFDQFKENLVRQCSNFRCELKLLVPWIGMLLFLFGQLFSLLFPFLHLFMYGFWHQNILQKTCFVFLLVALTGALVLLPTVLNQSIREFCQAIAPFRSGWTTKCTTVRFAADIISSYHKLSHVQVLYSMIQREVASVPALDVVAEYLKPSDVNTSHLGLKEIDGVRERAEF